MTAYQLHVVRLEEVTSIALTCPCGISTEIPPDKLANAGRQCACGRQYDDNLTRTIAGLRHAIEQVSKSSFRVSFRITGGPVTASTT